MRVIFLGNNKQSAVMALRYMIHKAIDVVAVVAPPKAKLSLEPARLIDEANYFDIPLTTDNELYSMISSGKKASKSNFSLNDIDLVISVKFWKKIKKPLIELPKIGCINFHPYPLPEFRGLFGYNFAIYENSPYWGVSAHFVDESLDTGDLIKVYRFDINPERETAYSLEQKAEFFLLDLFKEVIDIAHSGRKLPRTPQGKGRYISRNDFEKMRRVRINDDPNEIDRKIRAAWFPPYPGAAIEIGGREFILVNDRVLEEVGKKYYFSH